DVAIRVHAARPADLAGGVVAGRLVGQKGGDIHQFMTTGGGINDSHFSDPDMDTFLNEARLSTDPEVRKESYNAAIAMQQDEMPIIYLYHPVWIWALDESVAGFTPYPDGMIRLHGVSVAE
ncbi:MAG: ABC transporter substrate-binding protein, partial [Pseudomonadota bacterium]